MGRWAAVPVLAAALTLFVPGTARADAPVTADVSALDDVFAPDIVRIQPGEAVEWTNEGATAHTVTADDGSWDSGNLDPDASFTRTFDAPGVYPYHCRYHGASGRGMTGTVVVGDVPLPGAHADVGPGTEQPPQTFAPTVHVPADFLTIQQAVDHVRPGGMVLIAAGVYREQVTVTTPFITIRGEDRNRTIIDGGFERAYAIQVLEADGVVIQNLTARYAVLNGFEWNDVHGYQASHLTAYDDGGSGISADGSEYGEIDHSYASGHPDSGFSIGQCSPCHAVITDVEAVDNAAGFSGTNAGGDLAIVNSEWHDNLAGIVPNTLDSELGAPQRDAVIAGNDVHDNGNPDAPTSARTYPAFGMGIAVTGGRGNLIAGNVVDDSETYGIAVMPIVDRNLWVTSDNVVRDNVVGHSGQADLALGAPAASGDCFAGNDASTSQPPAIERLYPCEGLRPFPAGGGSMALTISTLTRYLAVTGGTAPGGDWRSQPAPPPQSQMDGDPVNAPPIIAVGGQNVPPPYTIRPASEITPARGPAVSKEIAIMGMPLATSWGGLLVGLYGYVLPFVLYATWVAVAMWDLIRQESAPIPHRTRWMLVVLAVPFLGPLLYFAFGRSPIPRQLRLVLTAGGVVVYLLFLGLGVLIS
ncbi:MAG TPA: right-handed parallel beta-helix repeat-containing protein [Actinomycetota bacterium]|nr:right-handed parallel beta-helix repeat-containing protein [Actinomycetota bacterium]